MKQLLMYFKNAKFIIPIIIFVLLLVVPLVANGNLYYVGGDDMRLYYLFPGKYLQNYVFNLIGGNTLAGANTGYATVAYYAPMFYFIKFLKYIPLNTQFLMYGLNLSLGFLFFYKFLGLSIKKDYWLIKVFSSLFYVLSPFLIATYYKNQMLSMYLVSIIPACLYYFLRGVREKKYYLTLVAVVIFSIFSTTINTLPWWSSFLLSAILIFIYEFIRNEMSFIKQSLFFIFSFLLLNFYWIFNFVKSQFNGGGLKSSLVYYSAPDFLADNLRVLKGVSTLFSPLNVIFNSPQTIFRESVGFLTLLNIIFIIIALSGLFLVNKIKSEVRTVYILFLLTFLISWFLFSPNLGDWGPRVFLLMGRKIPFFTMYRNMFDKFSLSLAFFFATSLGISLSILSEKISSKFINIVLIVLALITFLNARNYLLFKYSSEQQIQRVSGQFNDDYMSLVSYLGNLDDKSKVLWLPLNFPTYANIEDKNLKGHYYSGLSPLRILDDRSDYAGKFSFITETDLFVGDRVFDYLKKGEIKKLGELFQKMNAKYIVIDRQQIPSSMKPYLYGGDDLPLIKYQNESFFNGILGKKLASFGARYDLYVIKTSYESNVIYLTNDKEGLYQGGGRIVYNKKSSHEFEISVNNLEPKDNLVLLESFNKNWNLYIVGVDGVKRISPNHISIYNYANLWELGPTLGGNNVVTKFILRFEP